MDHKLICRPKLDENDEIVLSCGSASDSNYSDRAIQTGFYTIENWSKFVVSQSLILDFGILAHD